MGPCQPSQRNPCAAPSRPLAPEAPRGGGFTAPRGRPGFRALSPSPAAAREALKLGGPTPDAEGGSSDDTWSPLGGNRDPRASSLGSGEAEGAGGAPGQVCVSRASSPGQQPVLRAVRV